MRRTTTLRLISTAAAVALVGGCAAQNGAGPAANSEKIAGLVKANATAVIAAFNAHDAEKAVSYDAPDYIGMFHGAPNVVGVEADLALTKQQLADSAAKVTVNNEDISVVAAGDRALWRATYAYTFTGPKTKQPTIENGNWLIGWHKQADGSWKEAWGVVSDTGPAPAAVAETHAP